MIKVKLSLFFPVFDDLKTVSKRNIKKASRSYHFFITAN
ncbi:hypothetical protein PLIP_a3484 [Pseudoalteromonas lipolytica LMEB 39]|nr:hypothetical protein [Pseudoalteromonas lipolytica LMEB 39]